MRTWKLNLIKKKSGGLFKITYNQVEENEYYIPLSKKIVEELKILVLSIKIYRAFIFPITKLHLSLPLNF